MHASPAPGASPNDPRTTYRVDRSIDTLSRLKFIELMPAFGRALGIGTSPQAAFDAGMERVWDDAVADKYEFLQPVVQFYSLPTAIEIRIDQDKKAGVKVRRNEEEEDPFRVTWNKTEEEQLRQQLAAMTEDEREKRAGELTRVCQAAAISCRHQKREALATLLVPAEPMSAAGRRALWNEYKEEVRKKKKVRITQDQMAIEAGYKDRSEFARSQQPLQPQSAIP